jgi:uncharacterized protein with PIN domain
MNLEIVDSSRITKEEATLVRITIVLIQILMLSEIQTSLHMEETKKAIIIKTKNKTMMKMVVILIRSQSNSLRTQLLLRNRATSSTEIMMSKKKSLFQRNKNRKSSFLFMRTLETTRMLSTMAVEMKIALSAILVAANLQRRLS